MRRLKHVSAAGLLTLIILFEMLAFSLLAFRDSKLDITAFVFGGILVGMLLFQYIALTSIFRHVDRYLLIIANFLIAIGLIIQYRIDPNIAIRQIMWFGIGMLAMVLCILLMRFPGFLPPRQLAVDRRQRRVAGRAVSRGQRGIRRQELDHHRLAEYPAIRICEGGNRVLCWPTGLRIPGISGVFGRLLLFVFAVVGLLIIEKDLGAAVLIFGTALIVFYVATDNKGLTLVGFAGGCAGAVASYYLFDHVRGARRHMEESLGHLFRATGTRSPRA